MKLRKRMLEILSRKRSLVPDIKKYTAILVGKRPVGQGPDLANIVKYNTFDIFQRSIGIIIGQAIHRIAG